MSMTWIGLAVGTGVSIYGANKAADAAGKGADQQVGYARETRDLIRQDTAPYRESGYNALNMLNQLVGLPTVDSNPGGFDPNAPQEIGGDIDPVIQAYRNVLGRNPDPGGYQYYTELRAKKGYRLDDLEAFARRSDEYKQKMEAGTLPPNEAGGKYSANYQKKAWELPQEQREGTPQAPAMTPEQIVKQDPSYQFRLNGGRS